jgi:MFS family permease
MDIQKESVSKIPHYGWVIMATGVAVLFACLGLGRFALGMLLPAMGVSLGLSYFQMGLISTANFIGYMLSVAIAGSISARIGARRAIAGGLVVVAVSLLLISRCSGFGQILALYWVTGIGSGIANVSLIGLIGFWFLQSIRGRAAGTMIAGNGLAMIFSGIYVPYVNAAFGPQGWRLGWWTMGLMVLMVAGVAALLIRNKPADKGLLPMGATPAAPVTKSGDRPLQDRRSRWKTLIHLGVIYSLFGATYVVFATFIVIMLINENGYAEAVAGIFWAGVGGLSIFSGPLFGWLSDKLGRKAAIIAVFSLFTLAYALVAVGLPAPWLYLSIALYGLSVWSVPTIMAATMGDYMGPAQAAQAFGLITLFFSVGQISGPVAAGYLADAFGTFRVAFWMCAVLTAMAVVLALFLKHPGQIADPKK